MWRSSGPYSALKALCQARPSAAPAASASSARRSDAYSASPASCQPGRVQGVSIQDRVLTLGGSSITGTAMGDRRWIHVIVMHTCGLRRNYVPENFCVSRFIKHPTHSDG